MGFRVLILILAVFSSPCFSAAQEYPHESNLEPYYESPLTVYDPGWLFFSPKRRAQTFIRIWPKRQFADGSIELEAYIGAGTPKGRYKGLAKKDLAGASIQVSLIGVDNSLMVDGELSMSGLQFKDPFSGEPAPRLPPRVLSGRLTVHDGDKHTITNSILAVARESNATISQALGGLKVPSDAVYGSYLNAMLVIFQGTNVGRHYASLAAIVDETYRTVQKDSLAQSFHPARQQIFSTRDGVAFLAIDRASDVNALAAKALRSRAVFEASGKLGVRQTYVIPIYDVHEGEFDITFPGGVQSKLRFHGFDGMVQAIFSTFSMIDQEQKILFERFGIKALDNEMLALRADVTDSYKVLRPSIEAMLNGVESEMSFDSKLNQLLATATALADELSFVFKTFDTLGFVSRYTAYLEEQRNLLALAARYAPQDRASVVQGILGNFDATRTGSLQRARSLGAGVQAKRRQIALCFAFPQMFTMHAELAMDYVTSDGKTDAWTWKWDRVMPKEWLTLFFKGALF